jgi:uncharacterized OB-fold protein
MMRGMRDAAAEGRFALQRCAACGNPQYPPHEFCATCLSDVMNWELLESAPGTLLARCRLHHSNASRFRPSLPLAIGLVQLDAGPIAVCFLASTRAIGARVAVHARLDAAGHPVLDAA